MTELSAVRVIKDYFELTAQEAMKELKALSADDKLELAQGAAMNLGLTQEQCKFPLAS